MYVAAPFGTRHRTLIGVQLTGEHRRSINQCRKTKTRVARRASGASLHVLFPIPNGRGFSQALDTQHAEEKLLEVQFFDEENWKSGTKEKAKHRRERTARVGSLIHILLIALVMTYSSDDQPAAALCPLATRLPARATHQPPIYRTSRNHAS